nr:hypothetical protein [Serratia proteamaculans]
MDLAVTTGIKEQDYSTTGRYKYSLDEQLSNNAVARSVVEYRSFIAALD